MHTIVDSPTLTGLFEDLRVLKGARPVVSGYGNGQNVVEAGGVLTVLGYLNGPLWVKPGGLAHLSGYLTLDPSAVIEGEFQVAGYVNVAPMAQRLFPVGGDILLRPGTIFNVGGQQHLLTAWGRLQQLFGQNNITVDNSRWLRYHHHSNSFTRLK